MTDLSGTKNMDHLSTIDVTPHAENTQMEMIAKLATQVLCREYPAHLWMVGWAPGMVLVIKNMGIDDGRYGFTVAADKAASISELEHAVIFGGGELLERCGAPRGTWNGEFLHLKDKT